MAEGQNIIKYFKIWNIFSNSRQDNRPAIPSQRIWMVTNRRVLATWTPQFTMECDGVQLLLTSDLLWGERSSRTLSFHSHHVNVVLQNLTTLTNVLVTRIIMEGNRAVGVELVDRGQTKKFRAGGENISKYLENILFQRKLSWAEEPSTLPNCWCSQELVK